MANTHVSLPSATEQFRDAIAALGITPPDIIEADGQIHRFSSSGKPKDEAGWYVFYDGDVAAGAFGDWRSSVSIGSWVADIGRPLTPKEKEEFQNKQEEIRSRREEEKVSRRAEARKKANGMLRSAKPAPDTHPYLVRKDVKSTGLKLWKDMLLVPMIDDSGELQSLQMISADGGKKFLTGGKMQGCYFALGQPDKSDKILIAEGYATAATIHEATGLPVIVAYNAGNLTPVAKAIRAKYPSASIILCADDDIKTKGNPGVTKATEAAEAVDGEVIIPDFGDDRPDSATDFNDMAAHLGKDAVTGFFTEQLAGIEEIAPHAIPDDPDDAPKASISRPANMNVPPAAKKQNVPPPVLPLRDPVAEPKSHFSTEEFALVSKIWKIVPHQTARHSEAGYHLLLNDKHKVIITKDRIELDRKARHRPDEAYIAACEHARQFWGGQMEINGDSQHRVKAWAYANVYGVQVTNFTPTDSELIQAEKIMGKLRTEMAPSFSRPSTAKPAKGAKPAP